MDSLGESCTVEAVQYIVDGAWRSTPGVGNGLNGLVHADRVQVKLVNHEVVMTASRTAKLISSRCAVVGSHPGRAAWRAET